MDWALLAEMLASAMAAVLFGLGILAVLPGRVVPQRNSASFDDSRNEAVFIFDGEALIDCSPEARAILATSPGRGTPWFRLIGWLGSMFPGAEDRLRNLRKQGRFTLASAENAPQPLLLQGEMRGGLMRITVSDASHNASPAMPPVSLALLTDEVDSLRDIALNAPWMCWRERYDGAVIWANGAYLLKLEDVLKEGDVIGWPLPRIFPSEASERGAATRQPLDRRDGNRDWFDLTRIESGATRLIFALPMDATVRAETALRDIVQNLTRAFSHVPVGIAVFDPQRRLNMFNPALMDLTGLPAELLSSRPTLIAMLDAMRDRNRLPEPRDYRTWRRQLASMESASLTGQYEEDWNLPGGQTYRVVGRPQPDGSLVMMIDDISTEVTRVQRYRADLELGQAVIDAVDDAIVVFTPTGQLAMSNAAYARLWGHDHAEGLENAGIGDLVRFWQTHGAASPLWQRIADFVAREDDPPAWEDLTRLSDGRLLFCEVKALTGGATMATFHLPAEVGEQIPLFQSLKRPA